MYKYTTKRHRNLYRAQFIYTRLSSRVLNYFVISNADISLIYLSCQSNS